MASVVTRDGPPAPLLDTIAALWPHADIRLVRRRAPDRSALAEFALAPSVTSPRLAIPVTPRSAAAGSLRRASSATDPKDVAARMAAAQVLRAGGIGLLPYRVEVRGSARESLQEHIEEQVGRPVRFSIGIGTDRVNRKPVLELFDRSGRPLGFAKVGLGPVARASVDSETAALGRAVVLRGSGILVPRVLSATAWRGAPVLTMTHVPAPGTILGRDRQRVPVVWMRTFEQHFAEPSRRLRDLPWWHRSVEDFASLARTDLRDTALACAERLAARADRPLPVSAWHGDWTPWNMARHARGLSLWDWERFETGVPVGLDLMHYAVNLRTVAAGATPGTVAAGMQRALGLLALASREADLVADCYLMAINARYLPLAEGPGGAAIAARADAFLAAWDRRSRGR